MKARREDRGWSLEVGAALLALASELPGAVAGKMFGYPAVYAGRRLFACAYWDGLAMKLPATTVAAVLASPGFGPFRPYGKATMREWVHVRATRASGVREQLDLLRESLRFVSTGTTPASPGRPASVDAPSGVDDAVALPHG